MWKMLFYEPILDKVDKWWYKRLPMLFEGRYETYADFYRPGKHFNLPDSYLDSLIPSSLEANGNAQTRNAVLVFDDDEKISVQLDGGLEIVDINMRDVIGCDWGHLPIDELEPRLLHIYVYPLERKSNGKVKRVRHLYALEVKPDPGHSEDQFANECQSLVDKIRLRISGGQNSAVTSNNNTIEQNLDKKLLVLVNPFSGPGKAMEIFQNRVEPIFIEANVYYEMRVTEYRRHAADIVQTLDTSSYCGLVIVSGDGLPHEVLNGLMLRPDRNEALKELPLLVIPGGSGNALAAAVVYSAGEPFAHTDFAMEAGLMIAQHKLLPLKLVHVQTENQHLAAMMSITFGIISDIDIDSEKCRKILGSGRFYLYGWIRTMNMKKYRAKVSYLPCDRPIPLEHFGALPNSNSHPKTGARSKSKFVNRDNRVNPVEMVERNGNNNSGVHGGGDFVNDGLHTGEADSISSEPNRSSNEYDKMEDVWRSKYSVGADRVSRISDPVPSDWIQIDSEFTMVTVACLSHIQAEAPFLPWGPPLDEKVMYLLLSPAEVTSRYDMARFLLTLDNATHFRVPCVQDHAEHAVLSVNMFVVFVFGLKRNWVAAPYGIVTHPVKYQVIPVHAFRLEPESQNCKIVVDGELLEKTPKVLQGVVTDFEANVFCREKVSG